VAVRTFVRHCWLLIRPVSGPVMPFIVTCECGGGVSGVRHAGPQQLPCPICSKPLFVLPRSRWPAPEGEQAAATPSRATVKTRLHTWRMPLFAGAVTVVVVVAVFLALLPSLIRQKAEPLGMGDAGAEMNAHLTAAHRALTEGKYHLAFKEADAAKELSADHPNALGRDERLQLEQLHRQCDTLARLLNVPLQEIVKEASLAQDEDWQSHFKDVYQGHTVIFDDLLRADATGQPTLHTYEVRLGDEKVRLAVEDLTVLSKLPLDPPQRVLFGARLAKVAREPAGWVIHFDPESGVLFTDTNADYGVPLDDELLKVLERQQTWLRR
jgi:hypothetical protein